MFQLALWESVHDAGAQSKHGLSMVQAWFTLNACIGRQVQGMENVVGCRVLK